VSEVLARWNSLRRQEAAREILPCCGSENWAAGMASKRPIQDELSLMETSDTIWQGLGEPDWLEAFRSHPRIGESRAEINSVAQSSAWSEQ
jgi:2-oxo-4-hydroxy-4-carboxy-5-ureidoimidazoline decarboxylase